MHRIAYLTQVFLCAILVLNGAGAAASAISMHQMPVDAPEHSGACHDPGTQDTGADCCKGSGSPCTCAHAFVSASRLDIPASRGPATGSVHPLSAGHHPPLLPEPIRPPIP